MPAGIFLMAFPPVVTKFLATIAVGSGLGITLGGLIKVGAVAA
jgi:hypothetical protein